MPVRSEPDSAAGRIAVPRWVFLVWIWTALPISVGRFYGCRDTVLEGVCSKVSNSDLSLPWELPATLLFLGPQQGPLPVDLLFPLAFTLACHWGIGRFLAARPPAYVFLLFLALWLVVGQVASFAFLFLPRYG